MTQTLEDFLLVVTSNNYQYCYSCYCYCYCYHYCYHDYCKRFALPASAQPSLREGSGTPKSSVGKVRILRLGPGQGGLGWALLGWVAGWAGLKPVLGGLGCGLLVRVAGWAGPEAVSRQVRQAGLAWLGWLVSDTSDKPALGLKLVSGSLAGAALRGLGYGWAGPVSDTSDRPGQQADWAGLDAS